LPRGFGLLVNQHGVLNGEQLALEHFLHGRRFLQRAANEEVLVLIADFLGVLGVLDEVFGELLLLPDRFFNRANPLADFHLALDATFFFAFKQTHNGLGILATDGAQIHTDFSEELGRAPLPANRFTSTLREKLISRQIGIPVATR
jgi:hypothetical protein